MKDYNLSRATENTRDIVEQTIQDLVNEIERVEILVDELYAKIDLLENKNIEFIK